MPKPTRVRFLILAAATAAAVLLYLDRFCIAFAETYIREELGLSNTQVGWMLSAFFWSYALCQVPSGWLTDRFGARRMLTLYLFLWSLLTGATGLVGSFAALIAVRLAFGATQAGAYPTCAWLVSRWIPVAHRGKASSTVALGGRVGGFLAPVLTAYLIVTFVPVEHPSWLTPQQIKHPQKLVQKWLALRTNSSSDSKHRFSLWLVQGFSNQQWHLLAQAQESSEDHQRNLVAQLLNHHLQRPGWALAAVGHLPELKLDRWARGLLDQAKRSPNSLSAAQWQRLNRLVLEQAYPEHVRKLYVQGWRPAMFTFGAVGMVAAVVLWWLLRDHPHQDPRCNQAERQLILAGKPPSAIPAQVARALPWRRMLTHGGLWCSCGVQFFTNVGWVFLVTWLPRYLEQVHRLPPQQRGWMAAVPLAAGWGGMILGGPLTDWLTRRFGLRWGRSLGVAAARLAAAAAYGGMLLHPGPWTAVLLLATVAVCTDLGTASIWSFNQDIGGRYVGSVLGWGNMWGNLGAAVLPVAFAYVLQQGLPGLSFSGPGLHWEGGFMMCATAFVLAAVLALGMDASRSVDPDVQP